MKKDVSRVRLKHLKNTADCASKVCEAPKEVYIPLKMSSGEGELDCFVSVGDYVKVGTLLGSGTDGVYAPVHSSVSGTVKDIIPVLADGLMTGTVKIESDGKMDTDEKISIPEEPLDLDGFIEAVKASGVVGLGGGAYPAWMKLNAAKDKHIHTVIINGMECEAYLTSDYRTMIEDGEYLKKGIELLKKYLKCESIKICVGSDMSAAISSLKKISEGDSSVEVVDLEATYPQGSEQVLMYSVTGEVLRNGAYPVDSGVLVMNVTTLSKIGEYFVTGMPLVSKRVTVDGTVVKNPGNYVVPIGTPLSYLFEMAGLKEDPSKIVVGGPMMGHTARNMDEPVVKSTSGVIAFDEKESEAIEPGTCIHCGKCIEACPMSLDPTAFVKAMNTEDEKLRVEILTREHIELCMHCGSCSYVCPAHRPVVQGNIKADIYMQTLNKEKEERSRS
ncbi:MAG: RnfABCDGE type electron transport complex subunit C [Erysipelotrichaceae bacterium]|nr:RnfABCDGE type electron transport complex subunit C [Erysipelotrichaceae bacterium]